MFGPQKTQLIIVCDEKTNRYANYLRQLISSNDDEGDEVVGTVDGMVDVVVWLDKDYNANSASLSSREHILFIGNNKISKSETSSMDIKFNMFGMKYGWLGKRAMMQVSDAVLTEDEYNDFIVFCGTYGKEFEKLMNSTSDKSKKKKTFSISVGTAGAVGAMAAIASPVLIAGAGTVGAIGALKGLSAHSTHKKIKDQQYQALTTILYIDGLQKFLEG